MVTCGQLASGKTHTMFGPEGGGRGDQGDHGDEGLLQRAVKHLLKGGHTLAMGFLELRGRQVTTADFFKAFLSFIFFSISLFMRSINSNLYSFFHADYSRSRE